MAKEKSILGRRKATTSHRTSTATIIKARLESASDRLTLVEKMTRENVVNNGVNSTISPFEIAIARATFEEEKKHLIALMTVENTAFKGSVNTAEISKALAKAKRRAKIARRVRDPKAQIEGLQA